ncbi:protein rhomboid-like [Tribolium madens]|uniref:protein rhomboid-like n=1 Tax=Tribolium madens TaxID=41895 RepID=UPI001CF747DE|nr:protein rhomboid-like [Tribolium madens]
MRCSAQNRDFPHAPVSGPLPTPNPINYHKFSAQNKFTMQKTDPDQTLITIPLSPRKPSQWAWTKNAPFGVLSISVLEIIVYAASDETTQKLLRFEPNNLTEIWRFVTYMLLHEDCIHLGLNILMQVLFAFFLEARHGRARILALYVAGGVTGVLGAACFHPDLVIGASGGVYALLISHTADIFLNFATLSYKIHRGVCIAIIVVFDVVYNVIHASFRKEPLISWGAHMIGGLAGLFLGLVLFKQEKGASTRRFVLFLVGLLLYVVLFITLVVITVQIKKCTPKDVIRKRYVYFC